jgi:hypothetical protein
LEYAHALAAGREQGSEGKVAGEVIHFKHSIFGRLDIKWIPDATRRMGWNSPEIRKLRAAPANAATSYTIYAGN